MKIFIGSDHAGYEMKEKLISFLQSEGNEVIDKGAFAFDVADDYPDFIKPVAEGVAGEPGSFGIVMGASGQGEAICANRVKGVRAALYYGAATKSQTDASGKVLDLITSARMHNNANVLSLGLRFIGEDEAKEAVKTFLSTEFTGEERHARRIQKLDN